MKKNVFSLYKMSLYARFQSINTTEGLKIFRYDTIFHSENGSGNPIGLIYLLNPGSSLPISDCLSNKLHTSEFCTESLVEIKEDQTMRKIIYYIKSAYEYNKKSLPSCYSIHIENLFNLREPKSREAKILVSKLLNIENILFRSRKLNFNYKFVWLAWGKTDIRKDFQQKIFIQYPNAIKVHKLNYKNTVHQVEYPLHPLYTNKEYFLEATNGKIHDYNNFE